MKVVSFQLCVQNLFTFYVFIIRNSDTSDKQFDFRLIPLNFNLQDQISVFLPGQFVMEAGTYAIWSFLLLVIYSWNIFVLNLDLFAKSLKSYIEHGLVALGTGDGRRECTFISG